MDGTLLNRAGAVSDRNAAALRRAKLAGAVVVLATGRPAWWLEPATAAGFDGIAICLNGGLTYDVAARRVLDSRPLTPQVMGRFAAAMTERLPGVAFAVERLGLDDVDAWAEPGYSHPFEEGTFGIVDRNDLLAQPALKILVRWGNDSGALAAAALDCGVTGISVTYSSHDGLIEVAADGVNKGAALDRLARTLGIAASEAVAFGDMPNDREMLAWAGRSFAMQDADPIASAAAKDVAPGHDDDGVARVLERWF